MFRSPLGLTLKVCDFGASRRVSGADGTYSLSYSGHGSSSLDSMDENGFGVASSIPFERLGTEGYLSPEQLKGETLTTAIDMWAMGVVLYKCVTGQFNIHSSTFYKAIKNYTICSFLSMF